MIDLRSGEISDLEWAFKIKSEAEFDLVNKYYGWEESFQVALHEQEWRKTVPTIIEYKGDRVGFYSLEKEGEREFFRRFFISNEY